jgi:hypothetical protein
MIICFNYAWLSEVAGSSYMPSGVLPASMISVAGVMN